MTYRNMEYGWCDINDVELFVLECVLQIFITISKVSNNHFTNTFEKEQSIPILYIVSDNFILILFILLKIVF